MTTNEKFKDNPAAGFIRFICHLFTGMAIFYDLIIISPILRRL